MLPLLDAAIPAAVSAASGLFGAVAAQNERRAALRAANRGVSEFEGISLPVLERMQAEQLGQSAGENVYADPRFADAQLQSLLGLQDVAQHGYTREDVAANNLAQNEASRRALAERTAILRGLQARGLGGSGAGVALQIGGQRDAADRAANIAQQQAVEAQRRRLLAVQNAGTMAGQMRTQGVNEAQNRASAADKWAEYNARARQTAQGYNLGLAQQQFGNQMQRAQGIANASNQVANNYNAGADRTQRTYADVGSGIGQVAAEAFRPNPAVNTTTTYGVDPNTQMIDPTKLPRPDSE